MNILFLNTTYICGGAEKVTNQVMEGMRQRGHHVYEIISYDKCSETLPDGVSVLYRSIPMLVFNRILTNNHSNANLSIPYSLHRITNFIRKHKIDIVHLHNAHGNFLGITDIEKISKLCPVVWTLHDFWALTGHCTYPTDCPDLWRQGCISCSQLQNYPPIRKDIASDLWNAKKISFHTSRIHYTVPSLWMKEQFEQSHLAGQTCSCVPNSLDTKLWMAYHKQDLRKKYQIPDDKHILAFVAADPQKKLKGMHFLLDALVKIPDPENYLLLIAGKQGGFADIQKKGFSVRHFGYISEQKIMNEFYALADLLVNPSIYETFGLVNIEAMASGTPVAAFSVCAMKEIITPDVGWCIPVIDSQHLAKAISNAFAEPEALLQKGTAARKRILEHFTETQMLDSYESVYKNAATP